MKPFWRIVIWCALEIVLFLLVYCTGVFTQWDWAWVAALKPQDRFAIVFGVLVVGGIFSGVASVEITDWTLDE